MIFCTSASVVHVSLFSKEPSLIITSSNCQPDGCSRRFFLRENNESDDASSHRLPPPHHLPSSVDFPSIKAKLIPILNLTKAYRENVTKATIKSPTPASTPPTSHSPPHPFKDQAASLQTPASSPYARLAFRLAVHPTHPNERSQRRSARKRRRRGRDELERVPPCEL